MPTTGQTGRPSHAGGAGRSGFHSVQFPGKSRNGTGFSPSETLQWLSAGTDTGQLPDELQDMAACCRAEAHRDSCPLPRLAARNAIRR